MAQWISIDSYCFYYETAGAAHLPPLLFLHGFMGNCQEFREAIDLLSHQFYCIAVDLPGHGQTQVNLPLAQIDADKTAVSDGIDAAYTDAAYTDAAYTMAKTATGLIQFLTALAIPPCGLIGYSMGGRLALYLALHFPDYFHRVVLESASPGLKTQTERQHRQQNDFKLAEALEADFSAFLLRWYQQPLFAHLPSHAKFAQLRSQRLQNSPNQLARSLRHLGTGKQPSLWQKLPENTLPMLLLVGERDGKFRSINTEMAQMCPGATLIVISDCGHNVHFENPPLFVQKIQDFLTNF